MNGIDNPILFYFTALSLLLFAGLSIYIKNIFYSLLSAILVFFIAGMLFYILGSEYNAIIQIAVYGLAIPIILGVSILFTNFKKKEEEKRKTNIKYATFFITGLFLSVCAWIISSSEFNLQEFTSANSLEVIYSFASGIFSKYVLAFELLSLVLTIVIAGIALFKKESKIGGKND